MTVPAPRKRLNGQHYTDRDPPSHIYVHASNVSALTVIINIRNLHDQQSEFAVPHIAYVMLP